MANYDFQSLSPYDFELLIRDLLQAEWNQHIESFKTGRDGGVDLRFANVAGGKGIIQCKHYARSKLSNLIHTLKNNEYSKIEKLSPTRYIVATSLELSPLDKRKIFDLLSPYCHDSSDIFSRSDINNLLSKHPKVERQHYKLWLTSTTVLEAILDSEIILRSQLAIEDILQRVSLFVPGPPVSTCLNLLRNNGYCLISGVPGIGKTTTAEIVAAIHLEQGWECISINSTTSEALKLFRPDKRQLFFYDDFLGQTNLSDKLAKNEDKDLVRLMNVCAKQCSSKRFILTTREYLLVQAKQRHELLERSPLELSKCIVKLRDYTPRIRAQILVNHLFFFGIPHETCRALVDSGTARRLVDHPNYSPRIVEYMCITEDLKMLPPEKFSSTFKKNMDDPSRIWRHTYTHQLSNEAQNIFLLLVTTGDVTDRDCLKAAYHKLLREQYSIIDLTRSFRKGLSELEGTFIRIRSSGRTTFITFHSPSVRDFGNHLFSRDSELTTSMILSSHFATQISYCLRKMEANSLSANSNEILQLMNTSLLTEGPNLIRDSSKNYWIFTPPPSATLLLWYSQVSSHCPSLGAGILAIAQKYLSTAQLSRHDTVASSVALYGFVSKASTIKAPSHPLPDLRTFIVLMLDHASLVDDYDAIATLMEETQNNIDWMQDQEIAELLEDSISSSALFDFESSDSHSELSDLIQKYSSILERLNLPDTTVDYTEAEHRLDLLGRSEDHWSNVYQDDRMEQKFEERMTMSSVDSILDSMM